MGKSALVMRKGREKAKKNAAERYRLPEPNKGGRRKVNDLRNDDREARQALMRRGLAYHPAADLCQMQQQRKGVFVLWLRRSEPI